MPSPFCAPLLVAPPPLAGWVQACAAFGSYTQFSHCGTILALWYPNWLPAAGTDALSSVTADSFLALPVAGADAFDLTSNAHHKSARVCVQIFVLFVGAFPILVLGEYARSLKRFHSGSFGLSTCAPLQSLAQPLLGLVEIQTT